MINIDWNNCPFCQAEVIKFEEVDSVLKFEEMDSVLTCPRKHMNFKKNEDIYICFYNGNAIVYNIEEPNILRYVENNREDIYIPFFDPFDYSLLELEEKIKLLLNFS